MAKKPPFLTRTQKSLLSPSTEVRRVRLAEKLANPGRFSLKGEYYVSKAVRKVTSRTAFVTVSKRRDIIEGVTHSKATMERAAGERRYKTAASEAQAEKARETFRLNETFRLKREIKKATKASRPWTIRKGPRKGDTVWREEDVTNFAKQKYFKTRRRKLAGKWIEDGDWHEMMTAARATNDPMLNMLMKS